MTISKSNLFFILLACEAIIKMCKYKGKEKGVISDRNLSMLTLKKTNVLCNLLM